jgi:hypothetical protein
MRRAGKILRALFALLPILALAPASLGCPICFGESDAPIVKGVEMSVLFMVGVTYFLILGGGATFLLLRRRARRLAEDGAADPRTNPSRMVTSRTAEQES